MKRVLCKTSKESTTSVGYRIALIHQHDRSRFYIGALLRFSVLQPEFEDELRSLIVLCSVNVHHLLLFPAIGSL